MSALFAAQAHFFLGPIWVVLGSYGGFYRECLCLAKAMPIKAADSRLVAPSYSKLWGVTPVRRNGLVALFFVAVSRRGAPGGAVASRIPRDPSLRQNSH